jgi:hypothetical protein
MNLEYFEAVGLLAITPLVVYVSYWKGWNRGKREGYHAGRAISRHPVNNDR